MIEERDHVVLACREMVCAEQKSIEKDRVCRMFAHALSKSFVNKNLYYYCGMVWRPHSLPCSHWL